MSGGAQVQSLTVKFGDRPLGVPAQFSGAESGFGLRVRHLLPLLHDDGTWLQVSTEYVSEPQKGFSHYHTAKSAQEALCQSLSLEHPQWRFWVSRLPQMLTDQTNLPFHLSPPASPVDLADRLFQALETESPDNFHILKMD